MTTVKRHARAVASLKLPRTVLPLLRFARSVERAMTGNQSFPAPDPSLAALASAIDELEAAETAALSRTRGTTAVRDEKWAALRALLDQLRGYVQKVADANPETAAAVVESAGIAVRKRRVFTKRAFSARPGAVSGQVKIVAGAAGRLASYVWEYSTDGGATWHREPATLRANTTVSGLPRGALVQFRYRPVTRAGEGDWSPPTSLLVP